MDDFPEDLAIRVRGLGKTYRLGVINRATLRDELVYRLLRLRGRDPKDSMGRVGGRELAEPGLFRALDDVSFDVRKGETVGLIGRNGAGKSTMLKILSRITTPTCGEALVRGRVGSLLEVGTGFHPELTGRENIYLNGTILGMTRREIDAKFDEIVEFSEVGDFLETPVKRYSSGMYVKLAFSIASSLDTDILLLDEVLAVGDAAFQKKCLNRIKEIVGSGRTIIFVSHSMGSICEVCNRCVLFENGTLKADGPAQEIIAYYETGVRPTTLHLAPAPPPPPPPPPAPVPPFGDLSVKSDSILFEYGETTGTWTISIRYHTSDGKPWNRPRAALSLRPASLPRNVMTVFDSAVVRGLPEVCPSEGELAIRVPSQVSFSEPKLIIDIRLWTGEILAYDMPSATTVDIPSEQFSPGWLRTPFHDSSFRFQHEWELVGDHAVPKPSTSPATPSGDRSVEVDAISALFDETTGSWRIVLEYHTSDGTPWIRPRAALAFRPGDAPGLAATVFDSAVVRGLVATCPPRGALEVSVPPAVSFSQPEFAIDVRLWRGNVLAYDMPAAGVVMIPQERFSPGWLRTPFRDSSFRFVHDWSLVGGNPVASLTDRTDRLGDGSVRALTLDAVFSANRNRWTFRMEYRTEEGTEWLAPRVALALVDDSRNRTVIAVFDTNAVSQFPGALPGHGWIELALPDGFWLPEGTYEADFRLWSGKTPADDVVHGCRFSVSPSDAAPHWQEHRPYKIGKINLDHEWKFVGEERSTGT